VRKGSDVKKQENRTKLLDYLGNPAHEWPTRVFMNDYVLGYVRSAQYIYKIFSMEELYDIEREALALRRQKYSGGICAADRALFKAALGGDVQAIKLCYQRFEDWGERREFSGKGGKDLIWTTEIIDPKTNDDDKF